MSSSTISSYVSTQINVPSGKSIAIFSKKLVKIYQLTASPVFPISYKHIGDISGASRVFGPFFSDTTLRIETSSYECLYEIGVSPNVKDVMSQHQLTENFDAYGSDFLLPASSIMKGGIVCQTFGPSAMNLTFPSGESIEAASEWDVREFIEFSCINNSSSFDVNFIGTEPGIFLFANATIPAQTSGTFRIRKTLTNFFTIVRTA